MSTNHTGRIPTVPHEYAPYMQTTDDLQLSAGTPIMVGTISTPQTKWQNWGWTAAQSAQWTAYRNQSDTLYPQYADKKHKDTATKDAMHLLIRNTRKYDNDKLTGNHLLDKVALNGTLDDCETFRIKRSTPLAGTITPPATGRVAVGTATGTGTGNLKPLLSLKKYDIAEHELNATNAASPKTKALPKGIKFLKVYRYIGSAATPPVSVSQYTFIGNAKRALLLSSFVAADLTTVAVPTEAWAWYIARYESSKGVLGDACTPIRLQILRP